MLVAKSINCLQITSWDANHFRVNHLQNILEILKPAKIEYPGYDRLTESGNYLLKIIKCYKDDQRKTKKIYKKADIMKFLASIRHSFFLSGKTLLIISLLSTESIAVNMPPDITSDQECPVCKMYPARYFKWQCQVIFKDGQNVAFEGDKDMFKFLLAPSKYPQHQGQENILAIWVRDFQSGSWIDGQQAYFVVGSDELGPMGREIIPFTHLHDAENLIAQRGGKLEL